MKTKVFLCLSLLCLSLQAADGDGGAGELTIASLNGRVDTLAGEFGGFNDRFAAIEEKLNGLGDRFAPKDDYVTTKALYERGYVAGPALDAKIAEINVAIAAATKDLLTLSALGDYVTTEALDERGYATAADLDAKIKITEEQITALEGLLEQGYVTTKALDERGYATAADLEAQIKITQEQITALEGLLEQGYVTTKALDERGYTTADAVKAPELTGPAVLAALTAGDENTSLDQLVTGLVPLLTRPQSVARIALTTAAAEDKAAWNKDHPKGGLLGMGPRRSSASAATGDGDGGKKKRSWKVGSLRRKGSKAPQDDSVEEAASATGDGEDTSGDNDGDTKE